jgi:hypothetical protein
MNLKSRLLLSLVIGGVVFASNIAKAAGNVEVQASIIDPQSIIITFELKNTTDKALEIHSAFLPWEANIGSFLNIWLATDRSSPAVPLSGLSGSINGKILTLKPGETISGSVVLSEKIAPKYVRALASARYIFWTYNYPNGVFENDAGHASITEQGGFLKLDGRAAEQDLTRAAAGAQIRDRLNPGLR